MFNHHWQKWKVWDLYQEDNHPPFNCNENFNEMGELHAEKKIPLSINCLINSGWGVYSRFKTEF